LFLQFIGTILLRFKLFLFQNINACLASISTQANHTIQSEAFRFRYIDRGVRKWGPENKKRAHILLGRLAGIGLDKLESAIGQRRISLDQGRIRKEFVFGVVSVAMTG